MDTKDSLQESSQVLSQDQCSAPSTVDCLVPKGSELIPALPKPAVPAPVPPPHTPEQDAEVLRMFQKYALDIHLETWIRDPTNERYSRRVIRNNMEKLHREADKDNWNNKHSSVAQHADFKC